MAARARAPASWPIHVRVSSGLACKSEISVALRADLNGPLAVVLPSGVWAV
jgi:hypothetical protein